MASTSSSTLTLSSSSSAIVDRKALGHSVASSPQCVSLPTLPPPATLPFQNPPWKATAYCRKLARNVMAMATGEASTDVVVATTTEPPELLKTVQETWEKIEDKYAVSTVAVAGVVALWGSTGVISAIDRLPLIPVVLEIVGIGYSGDMSVLKRGRGGKGISVTSNDNTNSRCTCSTPQSRPVISPLSLQQQLEEMPINSPTTPHTQNSSAGSSTAINKGRGVYKSINVNLRTTQGAKIRVKFSDSMSRAIDAEARDFSNYCGLTLRTTVSFRDGGGSWKNVFEKYGPDMILKIKDKFEPADAITEEKFHIAISIILQNAFRNWKNNLHSHYKKYETDEDRLADPPQTISFQDWEWLLIYFKSDIFKNKSARNTINREKQMTKHTCGPRSFAEIEYATRDPTTGQPIPPDQLWEITHTRKTLDGQVVWADAHSEQLHSRMHELSQQQDQDLESNARMTSEEILATVLGERSGYVRGKGYGAEPSRKRNRPQSTDSSVVESVRAQLQEEFDKKFEEEREKMEAERVKMEEERVKMEEEREKMQQERVQFEQRLMEQMEQRIQAQFAALMQRGQQHAPTSSSHSIGPSI